MDDLKIRLGNFLESALVDEIIASGKRLKFQEGDIIIDYNRMLKGMPIITKGTVKVLKQDEDGREILLYYLNNNESCAMAYTCCMEARKSEIKAVAETTVELIMVPHEKLDEWLLKYPGWKSYIFQSFTMRFNELLKSVESIAFKKLDQRLVEYLREKSHNTGSKVIGLSHQQIAEELATSRVVVSRLLKHLENDGKVLLYRNELKLLPGF